MDKSFMVTDSCCVYKYYSIFTIIFNYIHSFWTIKSYYSSSVNVFVILNCWLGFPLGRSALAELL